MSDIYAVYTTGTGNRLSFHFCRTERLHLHSGKPFFSVLAYAVPHRAALAIRRKGNDLMTIAKTQDDGRPAVHILLNKGCVPTSKGTFTNV